MDKFFGQSLCTGTACGKLYVLKHEECPIRRYHIDNSDEEIERFEKAREKADSELSRLYKKTAAEIDEYEARIFSTQKTMLYDISFTESVYNIITEQMVNSETAVAQTCDILIQTINESDDKYISARCFDIRDISERVIRILLGIHKSEILTDEPVIIAAHDLPPSELVRFDRKTLLGFIIEEGAADTHAALLAKSMHIPAIIRSGNIIDRLPHGTFSIIDGTNGVLYTDPDHETVCRFKKGM